MQSNMIVCRGKQDKVIGPVVSWVTIHMMHNGPIRYSGKARHDLSSTSVVVPRYNASVVSFVPCVVTPMSSRHGLRLALPSRDNGTPIAGGGGGGFSAAFAPGGVPPAPYFLPQNHYLVNILTGAL